MTDMDKRARERRRRARREKRIRQTVFFILLFLILLTLINVARKIKKPKDAFISSQTIWQFENKFDLSKKLVKTNDQNPMDIYLNHILAIKNSMLVENSNHILKSDALAYDTATIRNYINSNKKYKGEKIAFLTFDDGPNNKITPRILDILKKNNIHATFFVVGKSVNERHASVLRRIIREGNSIALHSNSHDYDLLYPSRIADAEQVKKEAKISEEKLQKIFGKNFKAVPWRYPGGHMSWKNMENADKALTDMGIEWIDWNSLVGDAERKSKRPQTVQGQVQYVDTSLNKNKFTDIAVVLAHDALNKDLTADSLQSVIDYFKNHGYKFGILK